jgi:uncharacterized protein (DUF433 family)
MINWNPVTTRRPLEMQKPRNERIVTDPAVLLGKPIVRGTRVPVWLIVGLVEAGQSPEQIVDDYPDLTVDDVEAAVAYAAEERHRTEVRAL